MRIIPTSGSKLLAVAGAHVLACLACLSFLCRTFELSQRVLLVHAPLVIAALIISLMAAGALLRVGGRRRSTLYLAALFPAVAFTAVLAIDIASFATNRWLAISLTHSLVTLWLQALWQGERLLPLSAGLLSGALIVVCTTVMLEIVIWAKTLREFRPAVSLRPAAVATVILLTCGYAVFFQQVASRAWRSELIGADPVSYTHLTLPTILRV